MAGQKPNNFFEITDLNGNEELYSQAGDTPRKFKTSTMATYVASTLTGVTLPDYSTTEVKMPYKWIDNSDVYRLVIIVTGFTNSDSVPFPTNVNEVIRMDIWAYIDDVSKSQREVKSVGSLTGTDTEFTYSFLETDQIDEIIIDAAEEYNNLRIIIEYTK